MLNTFLRKRLIPLLASLSKHLPGWLYWQMLWQYNQKFLVGAAAVILNEQGQVLLFRHTFRPNSFEWGLPSGWMKRGETIEQGLEREVYEESRLRVQISGPLSVHSASKVARLDLVYLGKPLGGSFMPSAEVSEARYFSVEGLPNMIPEQKRSILAAVKHVSINSQPEQPLPEPTFQED